MENFLGPPYPTELSRLCLTASSLHTWRYSPQPLQNKDESPQCNYIVGQDSKSTFVVINQSTGVKMIFNPDFSLNISKAFSHSEIGRFDYCFHAICSG